jgi:hypothetical protein
MSFLTGDVLIDFCVWFHQDVYVLYQDFDSAVRKFLDQLTVSEKQKFIQSLTTAMAKLTDDQLLEMWKVNGAEVMPIRSEGIRKMFERALVLAK